MSQLTGHSSQLTDPRDLSCDTRALVATIYQRQCGVIVTCLNSHRSNSQTLLSFWLNLCSVVFVVLRNGQLRTLSFLFNIKFESKTKAVSELFVLLRCCQNGLVSVWTVPQEVSNFSESCSSASDGWWDSESKAKFMVIQTKLNIFLLTFGFMHFNSCSQMVNLWHCRFILSNNIIPWLSVVWVLFIKWADMSPHDSDIGSQLTGCRYSVGGNCAGFPLFQAKYFKFSFDSTFFLFWLC